MHADFTCARGTRGGWTRFATTSGEAWAWSAAWNRHANRRDFKLARLMKSADSPPESAAAGAAADSLSSAYYRRNSTHPP